jgi:hypothetical protein
MEQLVIAPYSGQSVVEAPHEIVKRGALVPVIERRDRGFVQLAAVAHEAIDDLAILLPLVVACHLCPLGSEARRVSGATPSKNAWRRRS